MSKKSVGKDMSKDEDRKSSKRKRWTGKVIAIAIAALILIAGGVAAVWYAFSMTRMEEVGLEDETVQELMELYFFGEKGCFDYENSMLKNDKALVDSLGQDVRDRIIISYLAFNRMSSLTYIDMNSVYHNFFGDDGDLTEKDYYEVTEGKYTLKDSGVYTLEADCEPPKLITCIVADNAYKNDFGIKVDFKVYTLDSETGKKYAGIETSGDALETGEGQVTADLDLPKWEAVFEKPEGKDYYVIKSTKKL